MMSTAIMHQSALYDFGDLFLKVSYQFYFYPCQRYFICCLKKGYKMVGR